MNLKFMFAVVAIAGGSAFHHGFHAGLLNLLINVIQEWMMNIHLERTESSWSKLYIAQGFVFASFSLGGIVGSLLICVFSDLLGRKMSLIVNNLIAIIAVLLHSMAYVFDSYELLMIGRFTIGVSASLGSGITLMYLVEISPYCIRGMVGSFYYVVVAASLSYAHVFGLKEILGVKGKWPYMFLFCLIPTVCQVVMLLFCPESPKYLGIVKKDEDGTEDALLWLRDDDIIDELEDLKEEIEMLEDQGPVNLERMLSKQELRSPLIISTVIFLGQQLCGIDAVLFFSTYIFLYLQYELDRSINLAIGLTITNVVGAIIGMILMDKVGRKLLLMGSLTGMLVCLLCFTCTILLAGVGKVPHSIVHVAVVSMYFYVLTYAVGVGVIPWFYAAELNNQNARAMAMTIGLALNWTVNLTIIMSFSRLFIYMGHYIFFIFAVCDFLILVFATMTMRETMNMETLDIVDLFYD